MDGTGVIKRLIVIVAIAAAVLMLSAAQALAYQESITSTDPASTPSFACPDCHGLEANATTLTPAPGVPATWTLESTTTVGTRKGPHGGYTAGTQKCVVCHTTHGSSATSVKNLNDSGVPAGTWTATEILRFEETIAATCFTCHDGTGGGGVYGVLRQRTGNDPFETSATAIAGTAGGGHRIGWTNASNRVDVPGGNTDGSSRETTFTGRGGSMTCTDCHSPHNSRTVEPFTGDRLRSANDTTSEYRTNRLLKRRPTGGASNVTRYGSEWCQSCHRGSHKGASTNFPHSLMDQTVQNPNPWFYDQVSRLATYSPVAPVDPSNPASYTVGPLGGNNFGYIMVLDDNQVGTGSASYTGQPYPICQQCHEDARDIGGGDVNLDNRYIDTSQAFDPALDGNSAGNPRFQNFPHETVEDGLLIETRTYDTICLNCHYLGP